MNKRQWTTYLAMVVMVAAFSVAIYGQSQPQDSLSRKRWKELTEKLDYGEARQRPEQPDKPPPTDPVDGNGATALRILLFILAGVGLAILAAMLLGVGKPKDKKLSNGQLDITTIEENLPGTELESFLERALRQEDYRLAVRLHYLQVLQLLAEKDYIVWKADKTNREYLLETAAHPWHNEWETLTGLFERIRYGRLSIDHSLYTAVRARFDALQQRLTTQKTARL